MGLAGLIFGIPVFFDVGIFVLAHPGAGGDAGRRAGQDDEDRACRWSLS